MRGAGSQEEGVFLPCMLGGKGHGWSQTCNAEMEVQVARPRVPWSYRHP